MAQNSSYLYNKYERGESIEEIPVGPASSGSVDFSEVIGTSEHNNETNNMNCDLEIDLKEKISVLEMLEDYAIKPVASADIAQELFKDESKANTLKNYVCDIFENQKMSRYLEYLNIDEIANILPYMVKHVQCQETLMLTKGQIKATLKNTAIECHNCGDKFSSIDFNEHICSYDRNQKPYFSKFDQQLIALKKSPVMRLMRENQVRLRRFIKEEIKIDTQSLIQINGGNTINVKEDGPHECTLCDRKFVHASGLLRHMEKHELDILSTSNFNNFRSVKNNATVVPTKIDAIRDCLKMILAIKCLICGYVCFEINDGEKHILRHYSNIQEEELDIDFSKENEYMETLSEGVRYVAQNCDWKQTLYPPKKHYFKNCVLSVDIISLRTILQCEFCNFLYSDVKELLTHTSHHNPNRPFECFDCEIHFSTAKDINMHFQGDCVYMRATYKKLCNAILRLYCCNVCEEKFSSLESLHDHRHASYHYFPRMCGDNMKCVNCEYCGLLINDAKSVAFHCEERHSKRNRREKDKDGEKSRHFLCHICGKTYTQSSHLWQHLRFHQGIKPFACTEEGCDRRFTIRPDLNDHVRKCHTGERPYHCTECGGRFLTGSVFYQHRLIHRGERRYGCEQCSKRFYRGDALKNHQRIHTGEKPYKCHFCDREFRQRGDRERHLRARHKPVKIPKSAEETDSQNSNQLAEETQKNNFKLTKKKLI